MIKKIIKYTQYNDNQDYLLITTPEAFSKIKEYYQSKNIPVHDIYIYCDPVERLQRCFDRENKTGGEKYKELIRRFLADEKDYGPDRMSTSLKSFSKLKDNYLILNHIENSNIDVAYSKISTLIQYEKQIEKSSSEHNLSR